MNATTTEIDGVLILDIERIEDDRGFFARIWDEGEFAALGMQTPWRQANVGYSEQGGTLRGMHFQHAPAAEWKLVRCTRGSVFDVALDLRAGSVTTARWAGSELSADNGRMLLIPEGCAHGYMTLEDRSEIIYLTSAAFAPDLADGVRWDDPAFGIRWPLAPVAMSPKDAAWPDWQGGNGGTQ